MERRITMNKIILTLLLTTSLAASANAQNCVNPSRCAELGYRDDVGKCSGRKTLLCPFDSNKAFCIDPDGGSGFYTCDDFLEAIKEVDGVIYLSRGLECDMTGKSTSIRFAEGLKVIGTADQPKIEFINVGENKPTLTLPGRNTFENLRIVNADISVSGNDKFINIQAENISGTNPNNLTFEGNISANDINIQQGTFNTQNLSFNDLSCKYTNQNNTENLQIGCTAEGTLSGKLISGVELNTGNIHQTIQIYASIINKDLSLPDTNISHSIINANISKAKKVEYCYVSNASIVRLQTAGSGGAVVSYIHLSKDAKYFSKNPGNWSTSTFVYSATLESGATVWTHSLGEAAMYNGIWRAHKNISETTTIRNDSISEYFTRIGDWDGTIPDDIN